MMDIILAAVWIILTAGVFVIVAGAFYLIYKNARHEPAPTSGNISSSPWRSLACYSRYSVVSFQSSPTCNTAIPKFEWDCLFLMNTISRHKIRLYMLHLIYYK